MTGEDGVEDMRGGGKDGQGTERRPDDGDDNDDDDRGLRPKSH